MGSVWAFVLLWGVWLITPVLVDGADTVGRLLIVRSHQRDKMKREEFADDELPTVTVIVPAHNEAEVIDRCLSSVKAQDYPHDKLEIIVVDDGSTDDTACRVEDHVNGEPSCSDSFVLRGEPIKVGPFSGTLELIKNGHQGKAHALNAGISASTGEIVVNIDSDVVISPTCIRAIASSFQRNPEMGAATGNIEIDWELIESRDRDGNLILDENGEIVPKKLGPIESFLARSQFLEYLASFDLGRRSQAQTKTMYTLAGACSAFRRSVLQGGSIYSNATVSEDTDVTFDLHKQEVTIGFVEDAKVYIEPVIEWDALYAQRVRWTRGQLEVCGLNEEFIGKRNLGSFSRMALPKMLLFDHTLAFPRLIWAPLILAFPLIGYSWTVIILAVIAMYVFYLAMEIINTLSVFSIADAHTRRWIERAGWVLLGLPLYRFIVFHFRFSGFLVTLTEEQKWTMDGPMSTASKDLLRIRSRSIEFVTGIITLIQMSAGLLLRVSQAIAGPLVIALSITLLRWFESWRKAS
jgi:poly-beta-1,6-N-acetyl-D-glucosamine synthase